MTTPTQTAEKIRPNTAFYIDFAELLKSVAEVLIEQHSIDVENLDYITPTADIDAVHHQVLNLVLNYGTGFDNEFEVPQDAALKSLLKDAVHLAALIRFALANATGVVGGKA